MEWIARIVLAGVFLYAGGVKALDPAGFAAAIDHYRILPYPAAAAGADYLPWLELACGIGVLWPRIRLGAVAVLFGLNLVFSAAIASAWLRGLEISCGCFGDEGGNHASLVISLLRSTTLALLCGWLLWREKRRQPWLRGIQGR
jgi:uncharacterized membrane protein YphA (DoxX/SURF4 family)